MKIFYTKKFKEEISKPYRQIELGKYKLRHGEDVGFDKLTSENVTSWNFLSACSPTSFEEENYYSSQFVDYKDGLQISLEIPDSDSSLYNTSFYQIFLFYFTIQGENESSLAFLVFEDFNDSKFSGFNLTSKRNIITIPELNWKCNFIFSQSEHTEILEDPWGQKLGQTTALEKDKIYTEDNEYVSVDSWRKLWVDKISTEGDTDWIETVYLNNFGLKIY